MFEQKVCYYLFGLGPELFAFLTLVGAIFRKQILKLLDIKWLRYVFISIPVLLIFLKIVRNDPFFLSDDYAHLGAASLYSFDKIFQLAMSTRGIWVGHRIFIGLWIFKAIFAFAHTNIIPYVFAIFSLNLINVFLLYFFLRKFVDDNVSTLFAFVFGFFYLSWISNIHELLASAFLLAFMNLFIFWFRKLERKYFVFSMIFYVLSLFTKEITFLAFIPMMAFISLQPTRISKIKKELIIFSLIFVLYTIFYAAGFLAYFLLPGGNGYLMGFSVKTFLSNLNFYLFSIIPISYVDWLIPVLFFVLAIKFKRSNALILLSSYFLFILPVLFFLTHKASYYNYIPLIFLFTSSAIIFTESVKRLDIVTPSIFRHFFEVVLVVFILLEAFGERKIIMDQCFLIGYPWRNSNKIALGQITKELEDLKNTGNLKTGTTISLTAQQNELNETLDDYTLKIFLNDKDFDKITFIHDMNHSVLLIK